MPVSTAVPLPVEASAAAISGTSARPNVGFGCLVRPDGSWARTSASVEPFDSGSSSVTTIGTSRMRASAATQAMQPTVARATRSSSLSAKPAWASTTHRMLSATSTSLPLR